jgi:hypothetical protein
MREDYQLFFFAHQLCAEKLTWPPLFSFFSFPENYLRVITRRRCILMAAVGEAATTLGMVPKNRLSLQKLI